MRIPFLIIAVISIFLLPASGSIHTGDNAMTGGEPAGKLDQYISTTSHQKLYLHFNKNSYVAGEEMWFNAYLLDAVNHLPDTAQTNIYVDLISSGGVLMERRVLLAANGTAEGDISLPLTLPDGNYYIRAYTNWMRNFDEDFFFKRYFYIENNRYDDIIPRSEVRSNRRFNRDLGRKAAEFEFAFFPEGGEMIGNVTNRVAFKAADALGRGVDAKGVVVDGNGNELVRFETIYAGMGSFELLPEPGSVYHARVSINGQRARTFELPAARRDGVAIRVERENNEILLNLSSGLSPGDHGFIDKVVLIAHTRGEVKYSETIQLVNGSAGISISEERFPAGITHFTVFSENHVPLAGRLVFVDRDDGFIFTPRVRKIEQDGEEYYALQLNVSDPDGNPVEGRFSMSVLTGNFDPPGTSANIISNVLLSSDLKGVIENPQHYFDHEKDLKTGLDHLMMIHGWRRFSWTSVLAGELPRLIHEPSSSITVAGRLIDPANDEPVAGQFIQLKVLGDNDVFTSRTTSRGRFEFGGLNYPDAFRIELSSRRLHGNHPPRIELATSDISGFDYTPNIHTREEQVTGRGSNWSRTPEAGRSPYALATGSKSSSPRQYGIPDQTIFIDRDQSTHRTIYDVLLAKAVGLQAHGNQLIFRGPSSIHLSNEPMYMVNGVQTSRATVLGMNPMEVERLELYRGTSAAAFGVRGGAGVIIAFTRQAGDRGFEDTKEYVIVGYHSPREFYSDVITNALGYSPEDRTARTILWEPGLTTGSDGADIVILPVSPGSETMKLIIEGVGTAGGLGSGEFTLEFR
jgi:hypothetical protein